MPYAFSRTIPTFKQTFSMFYAHLLLITVLADDIYYNVASMFEFEANHMLYQSAQSIISLARWHITYVALSLYLSYVISIVCSKND